MNFPKELKIIREKLNGIDLNNNKILSSDENYLKLTIIDETILKGFYACLNFFYTKKTTDTKKTTGGFLSPVRRNIGNIVNIGNEIDSMQKKFFNDLGTQFSQFNIEHIIINLSTYIYSSLLGDFFLNISNDKKKSLLRAYIKKKEDELQMINNKTGGKKTSKNKSNKKKKGGTGFETIVISGIIIGAILALIQIYEKLPGVIKDLKKKIIGKTNRYDDDEYKKIQDDHRMDITSQMELEKELNDKNSSPNNRRGIRSLPARMHTTSRASPTSPTSPVRPTSPTSPTSPKRPENKLFGIF